MPQNKNKRADLLLLKKLPGLLALCEFVLIPFLVVSPTLPSGVAHVEDPPGRDSAHQSETGNPPHPARRGPPSPSGRGEGEGDARSAYVQIASVPEPALEPKEVMQVTVTAYSSTKDQTDDTPFHTANGREVQDGIVAANFLPLGTRLRIPEVFGDKMFIVEDRMHERFDRHLDIWMPTREAAKEFGIRYLIVEIL